MGKEAEPGRIYQTKRDLGKDIPGESYNGKTSVIPSSSQHDWILLLVQDLQGLQSHVKAHLERKLNTNPLTQ